MEIKSFGKNKKNESGIALDKELKIKSILSDSLPIYVRIAQILLINLAVICPIFSLKVNFEVNSFALSEIDFCIFKLPLSFQTCNCRR